MGGSSQTDDLLGGVTKCVNRLGSSMIELVLPIIKYDIAPLEVGPEFALN